jgi:formylglycine-generating enzyme required for sulfatase activity
MFFITASVAAYGARAQPTVTPESDLGAATPQRPPAPAQPPPAVPPKIVQDCKTCPEMILMRDGSALGRYPVTRGEFAAFARGTKFKGRGCYQRSGKVWAWSERATWSAPGFAQTDRHPVVCVSWEDANAYLEWLSKKTGYLYRLPTLEELTAAAAGGGESEFWWGADVATACSFANIADQEYAKVFRDDPRPPIPCSDGYSHTSPVGSFKPNAYGFYDMSGNVWQWTNSCLKGDCSNAIFRGGGWNDPEPQSFKLTHFWGDRVIVRSFALGFRAIRSGANQ